MVGKTSQRIGTMSRRSSAERHGDGAHVSGSPRQYKIGPNLILSAPGTNTIMGVGAGTAAGSSAGNSLFGLNAGSVNTGQNNSVFGAGANTWGMGSNNAYFGADAGFFGAGNENAYFGTGRRKGHLHQQPYNLDWCQRGDCGWNLQCHRDRRPRLCWCYRHSGTWIGQRHQRSNLGAQCRDRYDHAADEVARCQRRHLHIVGRPWSHPQVVHRQFLHLDHG